MALRVVAVGVEAVVVGGVRVLCVWWLPVWCSVVASVRSIVVSVCVSAACALYSVLPACVVRCVFVCGDSMCRVATTKEWRGKQARRAG